MSHFTTGNLHVHNLVTLADDINNAEMIDNVIRTDIPDPVAEPELHERVVKFMLHTHCTVNPKAPCVVNGKCCKNFPYEYQDETLLRIGLKIIKFNFKANHRCTKDHEMGLLLKRSLAVKSTHLIRVTSYHTTQHFSCDLIVRIYSIFLF